MGLQSRAPFQISSYPLRHQQGYVLCLVEFLKNCSLILNKEFKLIDIEGESINLNSIKGSEATLVVFSCNTCPWVIKWEDRYLEIAKNYTPKGVSMIAVNSNVSRFDGDDSLGKMKEHASKMNYNFIYAQDPNAELAHAFGATKTPHIYLFDKIITRKYDIF